MVIEESIRYYKSEKNFKRNVKKLQEFHTFIDPQNLNDLFHIYYDCGINLRMNKKQLQHQSDDLWTLMDFHMKKAKFDPGAFGRLTFTKRVSSTHFWSQIGSASAPFVLIISWTFCKICSLKLVCTTESSSLPLTLLFYDFNGGHNHSKMFPERRSLHKGALF